MVCCSIFVNPLARYQWRKEVHSIKDRPCYITVANMVPGGINTDLSPRVCMGVTEYSYIPLKIWNIQTHLSFLATTVRQGDELLMHL